ncbi:hypothetical protein [Stieleria mannarensis]|uniref:hypothetical protein n=1 Tax=Stieleria mannarensis TaxID=2755585 RepID=UPI001603BAAA|nr:hypothetical protein [Rhodopirellula sp. JC639]
MIRSHPSCVRLVGTLLLLCVPAVVSAQEAQDDKPKEFKNRFLEMAGRISIAPAGRSQESFTLHRQPALSWSNPARQTTAGAMFLWTASGRPQVALCLYPNGEHVIDLEFQSLSDQALTADNDGQLVWQPGEPGIRWQTLDDAPPPARSPLLRRRQMRVLAQSFASRLVPPNKNPIELRLLDTPVYRYELDEKAPVMIDEGEAELIDGAVFTFVQGTDPEVLVLLEAVKAGDRQVWQYALARMSIVPTQVRHGDAIVWETNWAVQRPSTPYYVYRSF